MIDKDLLTIGLDFDVEPLDFDVEPLDFEADFSPFEVDFSQELLDPSRLLPTTRPRLAIRSPPSKPHWPAPRRPRSVRPRRRFATSTGS